MLIGITQTELGTTKDIEYAQSVPEVVGPSRRLAPAHLPNDGANTEIPTGLSAVVRGGAAWMHRRCAGRESFKRQAENGLGDGC